MSDKVQSAQSDSPTSGDSKQAVPDIGRSAKAKIPETLSEEDLKKIAERVALILDDRAESVKAPSSFSNERFKTSGEKLEISDGFNFKTGELDTALGKLSPRRQGFWPKLIADPSFGRINLTKGEWKDVFTDVDKRPRLLRVQLINPKALESLGRPQRRSLIQRLAKIETTICVRDSEDTDITERHGRQSGDKVSLATLMIVGVGLRNGHQWLFAELTGLTPLKVMQDMTKFCRPPFMTLEDIPYFVHAAARGIATHHDPVEEPTKIAQCAADIVAFLLRSTKGLVENKNLVHISYLFRNLLASWSDDKDRGTQIGLVLAGIQKYLRDGKERLEDKLRLGQLIVGTVFAGLGAIPVGGPAAAALQPGVEYLVEREGKKRLKKWEDLTNHIKEEYDKTIGFPVFKDGFKEFTNDDGTKETINIKYRPFKEWTNNMLLYNGFPPFQ